MEEKRYVGEALKKWGYPDWALVDIVAGAAKRGREARGERTKERKCQDRVMIPYVKGVSEYHHPLETAGQPATEVGAP